ncbi:MAG TPA: substrate-binding domain-containing protein, partial [Bryobacteraceae bacterium]|nr:substrate-binding domain-containing protein [Bryobacteraceae bacterium]
MRNHLADLRKSRGISAAELAELGGLTRQAIYAIEAGAYMPNTAVSLRLARILETTVETLFSIDDEPDKTLTMEFEALDPDSPPAPGEPLQICKVAKSVIGVAASSLPAWLPMADGITETRRRALLATSVEMESRVLVAGCDPALSLLAAHALKAGVEVVLASANSARSLAWLRGGKVHIAGNHPGADAGESGLAAINFACWQEGLALQPGNPKSIRSVADLARPDVTIAMRDAGSGAQRLLEQEMKRTGVAATSIHSLPGVAATHLAAAWSVASGNADCCIAASSAARRFGLDFIPLSEE